MRRGASRTCGTQRTNCQLRSNSPRRGWHVRVQAMNTSLDLSARGSELEAELARVGAVLHLNDRAGSHVLQRVLGSAEKKRCKRLKARGESKGGRTWRPAKR